MSQFLTNKPVPLELIPALLDAYKCVEAGYPNLAIKLPQGLLSLPDEAFMDEDGWYCEALDLFTTWELQSFQVME